MQWNDLPTKIQRELFEHAISMGELNHTSGRWPCSDLTRQNALVLFCSFV
jgi:hypothetical protein